MIHVRDGRAVWVSSSAERVLGAPAEYWIGREGTEIVPPDDWSAFAERQAILARGGSVQQRVRIVSLHSGAHWMHLHSRPFYDADGRQDGFIASLRLIDDEVAAERAVEDARRAQARADAIYRRSMESAATGMCLVRPEGAFVQVNQALCEFFGYSADELLQKTWIELTAPEYLQADFAKAADLMAGKVNSFRTIKQYIHADGHRIWADQSVGSVRRSDGSIEVNVVQIVDITAQVEAEEMLERMARFDSLTGLANRAEVIARLESALETSHDPGSQPGVLFCDVDHFKGINDTYGHAVGDVVLSTIATRIGQCVRAGDTVGRTGGDEILVLLPGLHNLDEATRIGETIRSHVARPIVAFGQTINVTVSIGAALSAAGETAKDFVARADEAMYEAKARRDAVVGAAAE